MSSVSRTAAAVGLAGLALGLVTSCGTPSSNPITVQTLDRPADLAFACHGRMRLLGDNALADATDAVEFQPHPLESCRIRSLTDKPGTAPIENVPVGQEDMGGTPMGAMSWYGFALQPIAGTLAVIRAQVLKDGEGYSAEGDVIVLDGDELAPGFNSLSVASQPVAIATMPSGCHLVTANAGSCDLSVIDVERVIERPPGAPLVRKLGITTTAGEPLLARPAAMVSEQSERAIGAACPAEADGLVYIAYPDCNAVAVVDTATGAAVASIRFAMDGTATIGDGNLVCPRQCGALQPVPVGARPVTLDIMYDDDPGGTLRRLAIGLENRPVVTVVDLGLDWRPVVDGAEQIELEGDVGVIDIALSKRLGMTGDKGFNDNDAAGISIPAEFVYAVTTDGTVRVAEVSTQNVECDTQVDPRYLRAINDAAAFICLPVGAVGTPPRRALAIGPGIELPGDDIALQVTITAAGTDTTVAPAPARPLGTFGHFAFVAGSSGTVFAVNIDDDAYVDEFNPARPFASDLALAVPHQLRDGRNARDASGFGGNGELSDMVAPACDSDGPSGESDGPPSRDYAGPPRVRTEPAATSHAAQISRDKGFMLPYVRQLYCSSTSEEDGFEEAAISELGWAAPHRSRAELFPDLGAIPVEEQWSIVWEGSLSIDSPTSAIDGPSVRAGRFTVGGGALNIIDAGRPFCAAGVEKYDHVVVRGCDPARGNSQCSLGEVCYVHPDSTVGSGACLPGDRADDVGALCRDYLISVRRYAVQEATAGKLVLSERRRVLTTTPVTGCTSIAQCDELAGYEASLTSMLHPKDEPASTDERSWACEPDPTRAASINRCVMTCRDSSQCDAGTTCSGGYCIEGPLPSPQCIGGLQRYELHGTDAFVAVGTSTGFLHSIVEDPATSQCVRNPVANPLVVGRIPLDVPPCAGPGVTDLTPNPCRTTVEHWNTLPNYTDLETCTQGRPAGQPMPEEPMLVIRPSTVDAIRFSNPTFTFNLVDATYPGDQQCLHDRMGGRTGIPVVYPGFALGIHIVAGFRAQDAGNAVVFPSNLVRSPDGAVWIIDEGDIIPSPQVGANTRGQIIRFDPDAIKDVAIIR